MRMVDPILTELESEAPITRRVLERVPEDKLAWRPHPKSMSLGRLAMHVAEINSAIAEMTLADSHDFGNNAGPRREGTSRAEILEVFDKGFLRAKEIVANTNDARDGRVDRADEWQQDHVDPAHWGDAHHHDESPLPSPRPTVGLPAPPRRSRSVNLRT
jgi:hypothetical protein